MAEQLAYSQRQAAAMLGYSVSHFQRHVRPHLPPPVFVGSRLTWRHADLVKWLASQ